MRWALFFRDKSPRSGRTVQGLALDWPPGAWPPGPSGRGSGHRGRCGRPVHWATVARIKAVQLRPPTGRRSGTAPGYSSPCGPAAEALGTMDADQVARASASFSPYAPKGRHLGRGPGAAADAAFPGWPHFSYNGRYTRTCYAYNGTPLYENAIKGQP